MRNMHPGDLALVTCPNCGSGPPAILPRFFIMSTVRGYHIHDREAVRVANSVAFSTDKATAQRIARMLNCEPWT